MLGLERHLTALPGATAKPDRGLEQGEPVRPGGESALAAIAVELAEDRQQGVVGRLVGKIVEVAAA